MTLAVGGTAMFVVGPEERVQYYLLVTGLIPLLLLKQSAHRDFSLFAMATCWLTFLLIELRILAFGSSASLSPTAIMVSAFGNVSVTIGFLAGYVVLFIRDLQRGEEALAIAHARADELLLNVLPEPIARRLEAGEGVIADRHEDVTVLFSDLVGFTALSAQVTPTELVRTLNDLVTEFDHHAAARHLEKIKTIGDAYMVAGGLRGNPRDQALAIADLALAMLDAVEQSEHDLQIRIGIHTGPVVAGVIGELKFSYDIWGDTVNTASRMESHGLPGRVQLSQTTAALLQDVYELEPRGTIAVKGKGEMQTWLLVGRSPTAQRARSQNVDH